MQMFRFAQLFCCLSEDSTTTLTAPGKDDIPTVAIPVEGEPLNLVLTHEFTHVVEGEQAQLSFGWERSIAHTIFTEGLAMRATQKLHPDHPTRLTQVNSRPIGSPVPQRSGAKSSPILLRISRSLIRKLSCGTQWEQGALDWRGKPTMSAGGSLAICLNMGGHFRNWLVSKMPTWQLWSKEVSTVYKELRM